MYYVERSVKNATRPSCTRYAWSTVGYPTLFISHDNSLCKCEYDLDNNTYTANQTEGSVNITGTESRFSLAIVFLRLIEFSVDLKKAKSYTVFNVTDHCDTENLMSKVELNSSELMWNLTEDHALNASMKADNTSNFNFKINVSLLQSNLITYHKIMDAF